jgi:hypothetical protein
VSGAKFDDTAGSVENRLGWRTIYYTLPLIRHFWLLASLLYLMENAVWLS